MVNKIQKTKKPSSLQNQSMVKIIQDEMFFIIINNCASIRFTLRLKMLLFSLQRRNIYIHSFVHRFFIQSLETLALEIKYKSQNRDKNESETMRVSRSTSQHNEGECSLLFKDSNITTSHSFVVFVVPLDPHMVKLSMSNNLRRQLKINDDIT